MKIAETQFYKTLGKRSIYDHLQKSLLPLDKGDKPQNKKAFLRELYDDIRSGRYFPSLPRGYIVEDKHNGVARIIPVFTYRDSCVFYFCIRQLEDAIAGNRVQGTYGGWRLGNVIRAQEDAEREQFPNPEEYQPEVAVPFDPYAIPGSFDPKKWMVHYKDFQRQAYKWSRKQELRYFVEFDIANFYDTINLDILERKIRAAIPREKNEIVDLLFVFLRNWNRHFEGYGGKSVGIPQDDIGDCSRMLANFYLREYDEFMLATLQDTTRCGRYLRYADDQIIMAETPDDARRTLFQASTELHKIGLNINSGKVHQFSSREDFAYYWAFDLFDLLADPGNIRSVNKAAEKFVAQADISDERGSAPPWRSPSVLKRLVSVGLDIIASPHRESILRRVTLASAVTRMEYWMLERIYRTVNDEEREQLIDSIEIWIPLAYHNSFHLNVLRFYTNYRKDIPTTHIKQRITELRYN